MQNTTKMRLAVPILVTLIISLYPYIKQHFRTTTTFAAGSSNIGFQDQEPSVEETQKYIKTKLLDLDTEVILKKERANLVGGPANRLYFLSLKVSRVGFSECTFEITRSEERGEHNYFDNGEVGIYSNTHEYTVKVPLSKVVVDSIKYRDSGQNPDGVTIRPEVRFGLVSQVSVVEKSRTKMGSPSKDSPFPWQEQQRNISEINIPAKDSDDANKLVKAFTRLSTLCGAKKDLFN